MLLFVCSLLLLPVAAVAAALTSDPARGARLGARLVAIAAVGAVGAVALGPVGDAFDALVLSLVLGMGATILAYAATALRHEGYQRRFATLGPLLVLATAATAVAPTLEAMAVAWVATSALTLALIRTGPATADPTRSVRITRAFAIGDLALVVAVAMTVVDVGSPELAAVLLVLAAAARCAAGPFVRWLPDTLAAPTPSSALLHAGVVGSGAIVLIRHGDTVASTPGAALAMAVTAVAIGAITCVVAEGVMVTRPDVKGQLAWSTIAQLSFTLVLVGLDLHVAAGLHLVAHGCYKGALFLGAGSTVRSLVRQRRAPGARRPDRATRLGVGLLSAAVLVAIVEAWGTPWTVELLLPLGLAWLAVWCASGAALGRTRTGTERATVAGVALGAATAYGAVTLALKGVVGPSIEVGAPTLPAVWLVALLAGLATVAVSRGRGLPALWARAIALGEPTPPGRLVGGRVAWRPAAATTTTCPQPATTTGA